jgi:hypothetical protein
MSDDLSQRAQDAVERFLEDESLTEDLTDEQAKPLISWLTQEAQRIALDATLSNEEVSATLKRLRSAVKLSCKDIEGDLLADAILARVQQHFLPAQKLSSDKPSNEENERKPEAPRKQEGFEHEDAWVNLLHKEEKS